MRECVSESVSELSVVVLPVTSFALIQGHGAHTNKVKENSNIYALLV